MLSCIRKHLKREEKDDKGLPLQTLYYSLSLVQQFSLYETEVVIRLFLPKDIFYVEMDQANKVTLVN